MHFPPTRTQGQFQEDKALSWLEEWTSYEKETEEESIPARTGAGREQSQEKGMFHSESSWKLEIPSHQAIWGLCHQLPTPWTLQTICLIFAEFELSFSTGILPRDAAFDQLCL